MCYLAPSVCHLYIIHTPAVAAWVGVGAMMGCGGYYTNGQGGWCSAVIVLPASRHLLRACIAPKNFIDQRLYYLRRGIY